MKQLSLAVRFACEIAAVVGIVWWDWPWSVVSGIVVVGIWGLWVAPKAQRRLTDPLRITVELVIFAAATVAYYEVGQTAVAIVFAVVSVATALAARPLEA